MTTFNKTAVSTAVSMISAQSRKLGADWVSSDNKTENIKTKFIDSIYADGVRSDDCVAPEKGADRTLYNDLKAMIVAGFSADVRKLLALDQAVMKSKPESVKKDRKHWQQQIGSKLKDLKASLARREKAEEESLKTDDERDAEAKEALKQASDAARLLKACSEWINRLEKTEGTTLPVVECLGHFKALSAIATKYMPA